MKKVILKILISLLSFVGTLFLSSLIMNRGNVNTTKDMDRATLPVVYMNIAGEDVNELHGYVGDCNLSLFRESITPLDEKRGVSFRVIKYGNKIDKVTAKVRNVDGSRLIESTEITDYEEDDFSIFANISFKDLMEEYTEYSLQIYLTFEDGKEVFYHTRIIQAPSFCTKEKLGFVKNFLEKEMTLETNAELKTYMESNYLGDNTTLSYVNIHSSMEQLAFANLNVERMTDPIITIKEIASETGVFNADYLVKEDTGNIYFVKESYRIKYTPEVTYLLDYDRTMKKAAIDDSSLVRNEDLLLGITDSNVGLIESDDGNVIAFTVADTLYSFNISENKIVRVFSFYDFVNFDNRTYYDNNVVKALNVDEGGNVWFLVSGYMNRGNYEGKNGLLLCFFNGLTSEIEERFFVESDKPAEIINRDLQELSFLSRDGILYIMLDKSIYAINVETKETEVLVEGLEENKYSVSGNLAMMVWQKGDNVNASDSLVLMNLNTKHLTEIKAPEGQYIKPLAFLDEDFIYGLAYKSDVITDGTGRTTFPMYTIKIQSKFGEVLKQYSADGYYVTQIGLKDNLITLTRVKKADSENLSYVTADNEYIANNQVKEQSQNSVNEFAFGDYEKVVRILLKKEVQGKTVKIIPKEIIYEGDKILALSKPENEKSYYYVYYEGGLKSIYTNPANAVNEANENYGVVVNDAGYYVWYRANRFLRNQIMDLSFDVVAEEERNELAFCLDAMLEYNGIVRNTEYLLNTGKSVLSILSDGLEGKNVLDLTGCTLDSILYYVNRDIPVLALTNDGKAYLVIGFNQMAVVVLDPSKGWYKMGMNEAETLFSNSGNQFITYVSNNS